ncbi:protein of unknown function [Pseudomonas inefficax]|uniref:Uncharacterized protein n=1 Tax=Pseudomonas inefficax TaxID=2078786 RepID=A0AAQ1P5Z3_9PSED|nr:protein of unknown function [Pseudomonas inefficax]
MWERPCVAKGARSGPRIFSFAADIAGAAAQPFRDTRPLPHNPSQPTVQVGPSLAEQISPVANGGCPLDPDKDVALPSTHVERVAASFSFRCIAE